MLFRSLCFGVISFFGALTFGCQSSYSVSNAPVITHYQHGTFDVGLVAQLSTGYRWSLRAYPQSDLVMTTEFVERHNVKAQFGSAEMQYFRFAFKPGVSPHPVTLRFAYSRPFENRPPVEEKEVCVGGF